ncbi:MAG TPA: SLC13 family permease, partial [Tepidisphaeraceae bacterium]|nr:SLC13 family permease [Tepidisphaeraceae bacterium]
RLLGRPKSTTGAQSRLLLPLIAFGPFLYNTPLVAMLTPAVQNWARKIRVNPSKLLIPLSYIKMLAGACTLIGSSTNLVVQGLLFQAHKSDPSIEPLGFWTLAAVGFPATIVAAVYILVSSKWLLTDRKSVDLTNVDPRQYTTEMLVKPGSAVDGKSIEQAGLRNLPGAFLAEIQHGTQTFAAVGPDYILRGDDRLIFVGVVNTMVDLQKIRGLLPAADQLHHLNEPRHDRVLIEAVVSNTNPFLGQTIREGKFRTTYNAAVVAVHRNGRRIPGKIGDIVLETGDTLLLEAHPRFHQMHRNSRDFYLVSAIADSHPPRHDKAWIAIAILVAMVVAMTFQAIPVLVCAMIAAGLMLITRCCRASQARRDVSWSTLIAIAGALGMGQALETTGAAQYLGHEIITISSHYGPIGALAGVYLFTLIITEMITNNAAAALAFPVALAVAHTLGLNFMPFAVVVTVAASAGFVLPTGYQTHLMVYGPGGYRFSDFARIGLPLDILIMVLVVFLTPHCFPFR